MAIIWDLIFKVLDFVKVLENVIFTEIPLPIVNEATGEPYTLSVWMIFSGALFGLLLANWVRKKFI